MSKGIYTKCNTNGCLGALYREGNFIKCTRCDFETHSKRADDNAIPTYAELKEVFNGER